MLADAAASLDVRADESDTYLVLSFVDKTLVLGIGETVEEVKETGFLEDVPTLSASRIGDDSLLQVHPGGIRHIRHDQRVEEWKAPAETTILQCAVNERQVAITLSNNELVYFELDRAGQLNEFMDRIEMTSTVRSLPKKKLGGGGQHFQLLQRNACVCVCV